MRYRWLKSSPLVAILGLGLGACGARNQPVPINTPVPHAERENPRTERNTAADRTSAALENSDQTIAGGERPGSWSGFGRGTGVHPQPNDTDPRPTEPAVAGRVRDALQAEPGLAKPLAISVGAVKGRVIVSGSVASQAERRLAMGVARRAAGTTQVDDHLQVTIKPAATSPQE